MVGAILPTMSSAATLSRVVVLAGGRSRRLGRDKLAAELGATTVLDSLLDSLAHVQSGVPVTVTGPTRPTRQPVTWRIESPPGGGPVAGICAGLVGLDDADTVAVLAGDLPFGAPALAPLVVALGDTRMDAAIGVDPSGADQQLLGAYRVGPLRRAVGADVAGRSVRSLLIRLAVVRVPLSARCCLDVDTPADLEAARRLAPS